MPLVTPAGDVMAGVSSAAPPGVRLTTAPLEFVPAHEDSNMAAGRKGRQINNIGRKTFLMAMSLQIAQNLSPIPRCGIHGTE